MISGLARHGSLGLLLALIACDPEEGKTGDSAEADADADTDSDADTDTDADSDSDGDADARFEGTVEYDYVVENYAYCDATIALTGTPYAGGCEGCEFVFEMQGEVIRDDGSPYCPYYSYYTGMPSGWYSKVYLGFAEEFSREDYYGEMQVYTNALVFGYSIDYTYNGHHYVFPGPYWFSLISDQSSYGTVVASESSLQWSFGFDYVYTVAQYYETYGCRAASGEGPVELGAPVEVSEDLDCAGYTLDVWTFDVLEGQELRVEVDTLDAETACDPRLWLNDGSGCVTLVADDTFECSYPPPRWSCPSGAITPRADDTWQAVVMLWPGCEGLGSYVLRTEGASNLSLLVDDAPSYADGTVSLSSVGVGIW